MAYFLKNGNSFRVTNEANVDIHKKLPVGNYIVKMDPFENLYLERIDSFEITGKIYGDTLKNTDRIFNTFMQRKSSTGVLLVGEKGSGKTLLAKALVLEAAKDKIPTIVINAAWAGDKFNQLMQDISQPCVVLFDEFEKTYDKDSQESMLTLLDGVYPSKKLFILTCNDKWRVDSNMKNRPGRIYYFLEFEGLEESFVREYCRDNLKDKKKIEGIIKITNVFSKFNFDMLKGFVEEINRYGETPQQALALLNVKPEFGSESNYELQLTVAGRTFTHSNLSPAEWEGNPLALRHLYVNIRRVQEVAKPTAVTKGKKSTKQLKQSRPTSCDDDDDYDNTHFEFEIGDLKKFDGNSNQFVYINSRGAELTMKKLPPKKISLYSDL